MGLVYLPMYIYRKNYNKCRQKYRNIYIQYIYILIPWVSHDHNILSSGRAIENVVASGWIHHLYHQAAEPSRKPIGLE